MFRWFHDVDYSSAIVALREAFPEVGWQSFRDWASGQDWTELLTESERA
ncbi:MAG: hypothetical protein AAF211_05085 [Myxococcota bacterium]